ncbi:MAG: hypothetical protein KDC95_12810 [Planctomycetes bacterium]|nr:hypothetical protein [Planctomycetota bacterium]
MSSLALSARAQDAVDEVSPAGPYERVVTMGASLTDGFANGMPIATMLDKSIGVEHRHVERVSSNAFFTMPLKIGDQQLRRTLHLEPTCVIAVDFLFWYVYGATGRHIDDLQRYPLDDEESRKRELRALSDAGPENLSRVARLLTLERGLRELEKLRVPMVIGDIPDMTGALPIMLPKHAIPSIDIQKAANERIHAWAKERKDNVLLFPLASRVLAMKQGKMEIPATKSEPAVALEMQVALGRDRLHPSKIGALVFMSELIDELRKFLPGHANVLDFDLRARIAARGLDGVWKSKAAAGAGGERVIGK